MDGSPTQELGNVTALQAAEQQQQQPAQNNSISPSQEATNAPLHDRTMMDDSEDYGPLKKKHKYRDERDKERSGSFSHNSPPKKDAVLEDDNIMTLDASLPIDTSNSTGAGSLPPLSKTELSTVAIPAPDSQHQTSAQQQQQLSQLTQQQDEHSTHTDLASSPGSTSEKNRRHKHNFYVPSRELAMLLDSGAAAAAAGGGSGSSVSGMGPTSNASRSDSEHNNHNAGEGSTAASSSSSLLAGAGAITGRQAQKIAAMEAKEQARLQKEKEAEELRVKRKQEADKKKAETARRKAEREQKAAAAAAAATAAVAAPATAVPSPGQASPSSSSTIAGTAKPKKKTTSQSKPSSQPAMPRANAASPSIISAELVTASTNSDRAAAESPASNSASKDVKPKKPAPARKALSKAKIPKGASPELAAPAALSSPDVKVGLAPSPLAQTIAIPSPGSVPLPPLPLPDISIATTEADDSDVLGFIPYASEGARAAALAKAAKQKAAAEGTLSTGGKGTGSKGSNTANGVASGSTNGNKRAKGEGKSRSAASKAKAAGGSGRASPVAGNEQLNNSQNDIPVNSSTAQTASGVVAAEEDEVDDRLYCICQQLYDQERLMIACDRCDNWYHADCINIEEASIELIDLFICPICEKDTDRRTVYKAACAREGCGQPALKLSKYCSDWCGVTVAAAKLEGRRSKNAQNLDILWDAVSSVKKLETVVKTVSPYDEDRSDDVDPPGTVGPTRRGPSDTERIEEEGQRLETLQASLADLLANRQEVENTIALANARLAYYAVAKARWRRMRDRHVELNQNKTSATSKKAKAAKSAKALKAAKTLKEKEDKERKEAQESDDDKAPPEAPCGFDVRLVWSDRVFQDWLDSDEGKAAMAPPPPAPPVAAAATETDSSAVAAEGEISQTDTTMGTVPADQTEVEEDQAEGLICTVTRRRCDRHAGWQTMRKQDYRTEIKTATKRLDMLVETEQRTRQRLNDVQTLLDALHRKTARDSGKEDQQLQVPDLGDVATTSKTEEGDGDGDGDGDMQVDVQAEESLLAT